MISVANTDFIQATIELFGMVITFVVSILFAIITGNKKKSEKMLLATLILSGLALFVDAGWYIYDGNASQFGFFANRICNFSIFILSSLMVVSVNSFLCHMITENGYKPNIYLSAASYVFSGISILVILSNLFYKWMYCFDNQNIYHRLSGWYVYTALDCLSILILLLLVIFDRKKIARSHRIVIYVFLLAPFIGIALQTLVLGISFVQIGIAIGCIGILMSYLYEWYTKKKEFESLNKENRNFWIVECVFMIMILCISASIVSCIISVNNVAKKNSEQNSTALAYMVNETIESSLSEPINVSRSMSQSHIIRQALEAGNIEGTALEEEMLAYMKRLKREYRYQMVFVSSEKTKSYYTYEGLSRYMDVDNDPNDFWYNEAINQASRYELNIDTDKDNDMALSVFVNMEVRAEDGQLLGICGVGMSIESLVKILENYEDKFDLRISLADKNGLIQLDADREKIERDYIDIKRYGNIESGEIYYDRNDTRARLMKYMDLPDWYLIVEDNNPDKLDVISIIMPSIIVYAIGIILLLIFTISYGIYEKRRSRELQDSIMLSETDGLTGLRNRYSMDKYLAEMLLKEMPDNLSIIMVDINGLKTVNDTLGHDAGDELIKGAAECLNSVFANIDRTYRIGGDEFIVILGCSKSEINPMILELEKKVSEWKGTKVDSLSVSIGTSSRQEYPEMYIQELLKAADDSMYQRKKEYYNLTGKNRRS